jgi:anti-sigma-K factor RskA
MNCEKVRELLPAYVMSALDRDELNEVEAHLSAGHEHDDELVELRATVFALDLYADVRSLERSEAAERPRESREAAPTRRTGLLGWILSGPVPRMAAAAAVVLAVFASGWLVAGVTQNGSEHEVSLVIQGPAGQAVALNGASSEDRVAVTMSGFEALGSDRVYQIWAIRDGQWIPIGVCRPSAEGVWHGEFPFGVRADERIALTVEPTGGSETPTSDPLLISNS